jgi:hypothetical protein
MALRVGTLAFATEQGLGYLARSFYGAGVVTDVLLVRHGRRPDRPEWYPPGTGVVNSVRSGRGEQQMKEFCAGLEVALFFETPFDWGLIPFCRTRGVATVLVPMHECTPDPLPETPDAFLCPSLLDLKCFPMRWPTRSEFLPVPVDVPAFPVWRQRTTCRTFVHNAGHGGLCGRNGTREVLEAWRHVRSPAELLVRCQDPHQQTRLPLPRNDPRVSVTWGTVPRGQLYEEGDAFLFPERFNGLSLPLQEARAAGMLVVATDRFPVNTWLPRGPLVAPRTYHPAKVGARCRAFEEAHVSPEDVAAKVDELYGSDVTGYSLTGRAWGEGHSWANLKTRYEAFLGAVYAETRGRTAV